MRLPILRHQDDRRLQHGDHVDRGAQQEIRVRIKPVVGQQQGVNQYPHVEKEDCRNDEFPAAAKLCDQVCRAVCESKLGRFLNVHVASRAPTQQFVGVPQPVGQRGEHFQRDVGAAVHEGKKMLARKHSESCILGDYRIG